MWRRGKNYPNIKSMKINLQSIDPEQFIVKTDETLGEKLSLVGPQHIGTKWSKSNLIFRSSIWNEEGELVSPSFKKFFNWGEKPDLAYTPFSTKANGGIDIVEKVDGSTLAVSKYKGNLIRRTRGTFDATLVNHGYEVLDLQNRYPEAFNHTVNSEGTADYTLLFEWCSPSWQIVMRHEKPDLVLIGKINHGDYSLASQKELDEISLKIGVRRPRYFVYETVKQMLSDVPTWQQSEGVCVYCNGGQDIRKLKSEWYLSLHRMKSAMNSFDNVLDVFFGFGCPTLEEFKEQMAAIYDFEIVTSCLHHMAKACAAWTRAEATLEEIREVVAKVAVLGSRKEQAMEIVKAFGKNKLESFAFAVLDGREIDVEGRKKLLLKLI